MKDRFKSAFQTATGAMIGLVCLTTAGYYGVIPSKAISKNRAPIAMAPAGAFVHDKTLNLEGYYFPEKTIRAGKFELEHIDFGTSEDFDKFEKHGQTIPTWTPFEIQFADMTSKEIEGELGPYRENSPRVFCNTYRITRKSIQFAGYDRQVGKVIFNGKMSTSISAQQPSTKTDANHDSVVLTGDLTFGNKVFKNISFIYSAGD